MKDGKRKRSGNVVFFLLWGTQLLSLLGTDVTQFALRIHIYEEKKSVLSFAFVSFWTTAPALLLSPWTGALGDRFSRRLCMACADAVAAVATISVALLWVGGGLTPWQVYASSVVTSIAGSVQWPAFKATVALLVSPEEYVRYAGIDQAAPAISMLLSPVAGGFIVSRFGVQGAFALEFVTFGAAMLTTMLARIPEPRRAKGSAANRPSMLSEAAVAYEFVAARPGLMGLLMLLAVGHFTSGMVQVLMMPVILNIGGPDVLGYVLSVSGTGALVGSLAVWALGGPRRRSVAVLLCGALQGMLLAGCGVVRSARAILACAFCYMAVIPLNRASREAIWQQKVPVGMQARVFGLQRAVAEAAGPLAALAAGALADGYCEPWLMEPEGRLVGTAAATLVGTGRGRGAALLFVTAGLLSVTAAAAGAAFRPLRRVDIDLPDAVAEGGGGASPPVPPPSSQRTAKGDSNGSGNGSRKVVKSAR